MLVSIQNGVLKDSYLRSAYDEAHVIGGVGYVATTISRPGVITRTGPLERLIVGEFDGRRSPRIHGFHQTCLAGGIKAEVSTDIRREIWEKFVFLVGLSATTATMRVAIGSIRDNPQTRAFLLDVMREVVAVGRDHGVPLPEDYAEQRLRFADGVAPDMTSSMYHDLERGKPLEVRWLSGGVVQLGQEVGIETPLNRAVADILSLQRAAKTLTDWDRRAGVVARQRATETRPAVRNGQRRRSRTSRARSDRGRCPRTGSPHHRGRDPRAPARAGR